MKVVWTPRAVDDLDDLTDYLAVRSPDTAVRVAGKIYTQINQLASTPHIGRIGDVPDTREWVFHPWPYIAVYRVVGEELRILRVRHASQDWPVSGGTS